MTHIAERRRLPRGRRLLITTVAGLAGAIPGVAHAAAPVVGVHIKAGPRSIGGRVATSMMTLQTTFSTDTPGAQLFTVRRAELFFPDRTSGRWFPSCSAAQIERLHGDTAACPKGSQVGSGSLTAQVLPAGVEAAGRVRVFNSRRGRSITFNIQTTEPAVINESFDAPLTLLRGAYPMKMVMDVPAELQEVLPGLFVGLETFNVTISAVRTVHGVRRHYLPTVCPPRGLHAEFAFLDSATGQPATFAADAGLDCRDDWKGRH